MLKTLTAALVLTHLVQALPADTGSATSSVANTSVQPSAAPASATTSPEQEAQRAEQQAQYDAWTARLDEFANTYSNADIIAATNVTVTYPTANDYYVCGQYNPIEFNVVAPISFYLPEGVNATGYLGSFNADYTIARIIYPKSGNATFNPSTRSIVGVVNNYTLVTLPAFRVSECAMDNVVSFMVVNSSCMAVDSNFNLSCVWAASEPFSYKKFGTEMQRPWTNESGVPTMTHAPSSAISITATSAGLAAVVGAALATLLTAVL